MNCFEARELFSPLMDGEISPNKITALEAHLAVCESCQQEWQEWEAISSALKNTALPVFPAPIGFSARVMENIVPEGQQNRKGAAFYHSRPWHRFIVGLAAALLLVIASAVVMPANMAQIADNIITAIRVEQPAEKPGTPPPLAPVLTGPDEKMPAEPAGEEQEMITATEENQEEGIDAPAVLDKPAEQKEERLTIAENNSQIQNGETISAATNRPEREAPREFLKKERVITTTLLVLKISDPLATQDRANLAAANAGARIQFLGQQSSNSQTYLASKITVLSQQAGSLLNQLSQMGTEVERKVEKKDLTNQFAETLEQYRALVSQRDNREGADTDSQLEEQIRTLENKLITWDQEAETATIVLWLQR